MTGRLSGRPLVAVFGRPRRQVACRPAPERQLGADATSGEPRGYNSRQKPAGRAPTTDRPAGGPRALHCRRDRSGLVWTADQEADVSGRFGGASQCCCGDRPSRQRAIAVSCGGHSPRPDPRQMDGGAARPQAPPSCRCTLSGPLRRSVPSPPAVTVLQFPPTHSRRCLPILSENTAHGLHRPSYASAAHMKAALMCSEACSRLSLSLSLLSPVMGVSGRGASFLHIGTKTVMPWWPRARKYSTASRMPRHEKRSLLP